MRFMLIVKASKESEAGVLPDEKALGDMAKFNEEMVKPGVMLAGDGLQAQLEREPGCDSLAVKLDGHPAVRRDQGFRGRVPDHPGEVERRGRRRGPGGYLFEV